MKNPLYNRQHIREYLLFGAMAAIAYIIFVLIFLTRNNYENLYLPYLGNIAFIIVIAVHAFLQINKKYEGKSSGRMMITSHLAALAGVVFASLLVLVSVFLYFPHLSSTMPPDQIIENTPLNEVRRPADLLVMLLINATIPNFALGAFFSVLISYVCKRNQTKDTPAELDRNIKIIKR